MSKKSYIKKAARKFMDDNSFLWIEHSNWYVGITGNPRQRKAKHGNPSRWKVWKTESAAIARRLEREFLSLGMQGNTGGGTNPNYIYIYKR